MTFKKFVEFFNEIWQMESKLIFSFWYLPNQVFWKAILTTAKKEGFSDFEELCRMLRKLYYSYWIAGYTTSKIKQVSFNLIDSINKKKKMDEIKAEISKKLAEDNVFKRVKESLNDDVYGEAWLKPLLALIEYEQTDDSKIFFIELDRKLHADHILPEKWQQIEKWKEKWTEEQAKRWVHKIGNLTLLSGKKNIQASNNAFDEKRKIYKGKGIDGTVAFLITQKVIENSDWTENEVNERQKWMLGQVQRILEIDLSKNMLRSDSTAGIKNELSYH